MKIVTDTARAELVIGRLLVALRNKQFPYGEDWALPQTFIPEGIRSDPLLHSRFLFYCCHYMRGTIKSDMAVKRLVELWQDRPEFFDPVIVSTELSPEDIQRTLGGILAYKVSEIAPFWKENSRRLVENWKGDPCNIFADIKSPEELYARVTNRSGGKLPVGFLGFQEKMASMLLYFLLEANLMPELAASPPVDFHLLRVMLANEILIPEERTFRKLRYEHAEPRGRELLEWYGREHNVPVVELGNALWMLSVVLCSRAPGNGSSGRQKRVSGKKLIPTPQVVDWNNPQHRSGHLYACGRCPIESTCSWNVMSGDYYQTGSLNSRPRLKPSHEDLHPLLGETLVHVHPRGKVASVTKPATKSVPSHHLFPGVDLGKRPKREEAIIPPEEDA